MTNSNLPQPLLVSPREAARMLSISPRTLWALTNVGTVRCVRIGRAVRYNPDDLKHYVAAQCEGGAK
jgi:excisionase family DNA binding protein